MVSIFTHIPISGRLSSTSIRLPTHIETIMPQNRAGSSVTTLGPGVMPWMIRAPIISAITGLRRDAQGQHRDERGLRAGVVGALGRRHALDRALAELRPVGREPLFHGVGGERGEHRPAARQDAEDRAQAGAAQDRADDAPEIVARQHQPADVPDHHAAASARARDSG